jgi:MYXO-CTERM domain-containing protein
VTPSEDCTTQCNSSCTASCTAQANASCQIQCQEASFPQCKNDYVQTCTTQCNQPEGALFCNGNYVDVGGNLAQCVDALNAVLTSKIDVTVTASGSANGTSTTKVSCAASPSPAPGGPMAAFGAVMAVTIAAVRRRAKRARRA